MISDFKVIRGLGRGAYGQVFMVRDPQQSPYNIQARQILCNEDHPKKDNKLCLRTSSYIILTIYPLSYGSSIHRQTPLCIPKYQKALSIMRFNVRSILYVNLQGQLFYLLRRNKKFIEEVAKFYAGQILLALQYLHSRNIIYRDLKPENILLDAQGHIKLTDFGLSKVCYSSQQLAYSICGTPEYIAPEVISGKGYTQMADWFSFGSLLYDMLTGRPPFYSSNKQEILKKIASKQIPIDQTLSKEAKSLLKGLLKIKPKERLGCVGGAEDIRKHQFFANVNFQLLLEKKVQPPISFKQAINDEGFDTQFEPNSVQSTINLDKTLREKGLLFDGFTYYRPQMSSPKKIETMNNQPDGNSSIRKSNE